MVIREKHIEATERTPEIILNPKGIITIKGRCMEENVPTCLKPIIEWFDDYGKNPAEVTSVDIYLEYINDFSSTILISLLKRFLYILGKNKRLTINWYFEDGDEDILEQGEYISLVLGKPFNLHIMSAEY